MPVSNFLEDLVSHLPALQLLQLVGYQYLTENRAHRRQATGGTDDRSKLGVTTARTYTIKRLDLDYFVEDEG